MSAIVINLEPYLAKKRGKVIIAEPIGIGEAEPIKISPIDVERAILQTKIDCFDELKLS